jgi:hypothetical protein
MSYGNIFGIFNIFGGIFGAIGAFITDIFNLLQNSPSYTGGALTVTDYEGTLVTSPANTAGFEGGRLATTVAEGAQLGDDLVDTANDVSSWGPYGTNTIEPDGELVKITYVDSGFGAIVNMNGGGGLSENLTAGKKYQFSINVSVSTGNPTKVRINSGTTSYDVDFSSTTLTTITQEFIYVSGTPYINFANTMGPDDVVRVYINSVREVIPTWYDTDLGGNPLQPSVNLPTKSGQRKWYTEPFSGPFGYSNWPASTNQLLQSVKIDNASWNKFNSTVDPNAAVSLKGVAGAADKLIEASDVAGTHYMTQSINVPAGSPYTIDAYVRPQGRNFLALQVNTVGSAGITWVIFDLINKTVEPTITITNSSTSGNVAYIEDGPAGTVHCVMSGLVGSTALGTAIPVLCNAFGVAGRTYDGDGVSGIDFCGMQVTTTAFAHPLIETTTATVTRAATNLSLPTEGVLPVNDFGIWGEVIPGASGQEPESVFWSSSITPGSSGIQIHADSGGPVYFSKIIGGVYKAINRIFTPTKDTPLQYMAYQSSVYGMGLCIKEQGGAWSAWAEKNDADGRLDALIATNYQVGCRNNARHFAGYYPNTLILSDPDPRARLEELAALHGGA